MRAMWKGSISFGLVNIPVRMYSAVEDKDVRFNQLHAARHTPIRYRKYVRTASGESTGEIVRGYELQKGSMVITDAEWDSSGTLSRTVDVLRFVELQGIDPCF